MGILGSIFVYGVALVMGFLYGAIFVGGVDASIRYLLDPDWRLLVTAPLTLIGAIGARNTFLFFRDDIRDALAYRRRQKSNQRA